MYQMNLNYLDLSHNYLHVRSGKEIGKMLETNIGLKTLILGWNKLYPETGERVKCVHSVTLPKFTWILFYRMHYTADERIDEKY